MKGDGETWRNTLPMSQYPGVDKELITLRFRPSAAYVA